MHGMHLVAPRSRSFGRDWPATGGAVVFVAGWSRFLSAVAPHDQPGHGEDERVKAFFDQHLKGAQK
jgi:hypothetical protein